MRSYSTAVSQSLNNAMNFDSNRTASLREDKLKRQLALIEAKGNLDIKQQEVANTGAKDVQGLKNTGDLQNTQLTGDIQAGLRESQIKENMAQAGLYKAQSTESETGNVLRASQANLMDKQSRLQQLEGDITQRYGMDIGAAKLSGAEAANKYTGAQADQIATATATERSKMEGYLGPDASVAELQDRINKHKDRQITPTKPDSPFSFAETSDSIYNLMPTVGLARGAIKGSQWLSNLPGQIKEAVKKKKLVLE